jgi:AraC family transcriptional regulator, ethanolamine operon transcriptional activator
MLGRIDWLMLMPTTQPQALKDPRVCASVSEHMLAALARFDALKAVSTDRSARASRRAAVRVALDYVHEKFSEPLRLAELCRRANVKVRSLEYGFREVKGLTPIAYIRSLRLNAVRRALQRDEAGPARSITEIAMDSGFWHLGQFASDYRQFFGETPSQTRQRCIDRGRLSAVAG